jgi:hypothetical protein
MKSNKEENLHFILNELNIEYIKYSDVVPEKRINENIKHSIFLFEMDLKRYPNNLQWINKYIETNNIYKAVNIERTETNYYYVYALINKLNGQIFYIGKGIYDRLFHHEKDKNESIKNNYINEIGIDNIQYWIIENRLEQGMALSLESYLINKLPNLTNTLIPKITFEYCLYLHYLKLLSDSLDKLNK